jgi:F-type H+-transporting ATPase subunit b
MLDFPPNWTFAIQFVGFFALLFFLDRFLFRPYVDVLERREAGTHGSVHAADGDRRIAAEVKAKIDAAMAEAKIEAHAQADRMRKQAHVEESAILDTAKTAAANHLDDLRRTLAAEVATARATLEGDAKRLADSMVSAVLNGKA